MKKRNAFVGLLAAGFAFTLVAIGTGEESKADQASEAAAMQIQSSPEHTLLLEGVGMWDIDIEMPTGPDSPPMKMKGTERVFGIGALWTVTEFSADFGGMPFNGSATMGFDPSTRKFVGTWVDSMTPYYNNYEGTWDEKSQTITSAGGGKDAAGNMVKTKMVDKRIDQDHHHWQMFIVDEKGAESLVMTMHYTRRK